MLNSNKVNYVFNTGYQILSVLTPLITAPYISRVLGADGIGQVSFSFSVVSYFVLLATLGTTTYGQREIAYARNNIENRSSSFWNVAILRALTTTVVLIFYFLSLPCISNSSNRILFVIQSIYIVNVGLDITWYFQGMANFVAITIRNTIVRLLSIVSIFVFVKDVTDVYTYAFILVISTSIGLLVMIPLMSREVKKLRFKDLSLLNNFKKCLPLFFPTIAIQIYTVLDKTMIGIYSIDSVENGFYEEAEKIVKITIVLITSLSTVLAPKIATAYKESRAAEIEKYMTILVRYVMFIGMPICFGLISISDSLIPWFLGPGFDKCIILMKIFAPIVVFIGLSNIFGTTYCVQTSKQAFVNISVAYGAIINLVLNIFLIPRFFSIGASLASVIAEASVLSCLLVSVRKSISVSTLFGGSWTYIISSLIMFIVIMPLGYVLRNAAVNSFMIIISQILLGGCIYFISLLVFKDDIYKQLRIYIKKKK